MWSGRAWFAHASIASQLIRDGNRALLHNGYRVQLFYEAAGGPKLAELMPVLAHA